LTNHFKLTEKQEKAQQKAARRQERKSSQPERGPGGEDPDIAGIVPGPQASPWGDDEEVETEDTEEPA